MSNRVGIVPFWKNYQRESVVRSAQLAEDLGYDSIWVPEAWGYEQFTLLTEIAVKTKRIKLATGIANVFSRSAALLAMSAATLDEISGGRVILGLGTSGKNVIENLHGVPYRKPLTRLRETVGIMKTLWAGKRLEPEQSTLFELRHFQLEMKPLRAEIPCYVASLQEKAVKDLGRYADGWVPTFWPYKNLRDGVAWLAEGARAAGRDVGAIDVAPFMAVVPFDDKNMAYDFLRPTVSFYIGGMGVYYYETFCRFGFTESATRVRALYAEGKRREAAAAVSEELLDAISICGPAEFCHERLGEWRANGVGSALLSLPPNMPTEMIEQFLRTMAPR